MATGEAEEVQGCFDDHRIGYFIELHEEREIFEIFCPSFVHDVCGSPGARISGHFLRDNIAADIGKACAAYGQCGEDNGVLGGIAAHDFYFSFRQALYLYQLVYASGSFFIYYEVLMLCGQPLDGLRFHLDT